MTNPFEKRATEYLRDDIAFLSVVSPEPLMAYFSQPAKEDRLYDRLVTIIGTPGSGKTTLSRLFQYPTLNAMLRHFTRNQLHKNLVDAMSKCGAIEDDKPTIVGCRLPLEAGYRDIWELPYSEARRNNLMITLLQARAVLGWLRNLEMDRESLNARITIVPKDDVGAASEAIGGTEFEAIRARARQVETAIYNVTAALLPPEEDRQDLTPVAAYRPLDVIKEFLVERENQPVLRLRPLVVFDDAHNLHPSQLAALRIWLIRRELPVARWILMRLDTLTPEEVFTPHGEENGENPGVSSAREITQISLQSITTDRAQHRKTFRTMGKDMASRYLSRMEIFNRIRIHNFGDLLNAPPEPISDSHLEELKRSVDACQRRIGIPMVRRKELEAEVDQYLKGAVNQDNGEDLRFTMLKILMERYGKRVPQGSLFGENEAPELSRPPTADAGVAHGARIHLLHRYDRPYFVGIDMLCDASSENAEQFLQLASCLVSQSETQIIRKKGPDLSAKMQHELLQKRAKKIIEGWDFPHCRTVRRLIDGIAKQCVEKSTEPNASLDGGANGFGIPQDAFLQIPHSHKDLARVIQFGIAYNALTLVRDYTVKNKKWCLLELGGVALLRNGLTLHRGGFLERRVEDLVSLIEGE